jgi:hypothetical protein
MLYREIVVVCSQIHTKHINALCGQNVELLDVKLSVHIVTMASHSLPLNAMTVPYDAPSKVPLFSLNNWVTLTTSLLNIARTLSLTTKRGGR